MWAGLGVRKVSVRVNAEALPPQTVTSDRRQVSE